MMGGMVLPHRYGLKWFEFDDHQHCLESARSAPCDSHLQPLWCRGKHAGGMVVVFWNKAGAWLLLVSIYSVQVVMWLLNALHAFLQRPWL